ncbi:single-strand-selective monofunctional uracil-DNA glycosylase 1 isoform X2 [Brienomyrus brachyistius]|uniref:single-strand-selective monofunctional uracil-DNA glycosylase 1 isoform X2 n=1 Tax=Brienomyrus brachyistius TaxID=42636 RepID=UPI0020B3C7C0|nr:single-strand-selective monofunctional uracil-DNA glycosylase 1 isoform X2 [Brienomyrus brachyistius]
MQESNVESWPAKDGHADAAAVVQVRGGTQPLVPEGSDVGSRFLQVELELNVRLRQLAFPEPVQYTYNPLEYAWDTHCNYVSTYCHGNQSILFLGMNPGPFGMAQTGVPFGEVSSVRDWLKISGEVGRPPEEHPKRRIMGLSCTRSEVSGARFWGLFRKLCGEPHVFFRHCFVHNLCPLMFVSGSGKNLTPPELPAAVRDALLARCDDALCQVVQVLGVATVIGVGKVAEQRARRALAAAGLQKYAEASRCRPASRRQDRKHLCTWLRLHPPPPMHLQAFQLQRSSTDLQRSSNASLN